MKDSSQEMEGPHGSASLHLREQQTVLHNPKKDDVTTDDNGDYLEEEMAVQQN